MDQCSVSLSFFDLSGLYFGDGKSHHGEALASRAWHNALAQVIAEDRTQNPVAPKQMPGNARKKVVSD